MSLILNIDRYVIRKWKEIHYRFLLRIRSVPLNFHKEDTGNCRRGLGGITLLLTENLITL